MTAPLTISGALDEMGTADDGQNFVRIERETGTVRVTGLTDDEVRALAPHFFSLVTLTIGGVA